MLFSSEQSVVNAFHKLYYNARRQKRTLGNTRFLGVDVQKCPLDLWIYQEILFETRPDLIVETGTAQGGSALYLATLCDVMGAGRVVTIDIEDVTGRPRHPRVEYILGGSVDAQILAQVRSRVVEGERVMVILDSDHSQAHVTAELREYSSLVSPGSYLIVEDTNVNGHPVRRDHGPGPMEALDEFLRTPQPFEVDLSREKFFLTFNPRGYLRRRD